MFIQNLKSIQRNHRNTDWEDEINNLFNKKYQFCFSSKWKLPEADSWFSTPTWDVKELETLKSRLNFHKSQLNDFDILEWSSHTRRRNPAGDVCSKIKSLINPEFLTQAWTKFYECASSYNIVPSQAVEEKKLVSLHLCEAPGAFIASLNHYLKLNYPDIEWQWLASTLNPYYEGNSTTNMISDDRFMFHTLDKWYFGDDNTGNLMDWTNSQAIITKATSLGKVYLVTADGSIDCLQKPDAQEEVTSPLHYCEIVTALQALNPGGTLLFKLFTMFEHSTICLLYLINHLFSEVNIYKPVTSRQGNSEVYAICLNFKGITYLDEYIPQLQKVYGSDQYNTVSMFPKESIPDSFLRQIEECANYFCALQCQVINDNLQTYLMKHIPFQIDIKKLRAIVASEFIRHYQLEPLEIEHEILKGVLREEQKVNTNPRFHRGSFTKRQSYAKMPLKEKLESLNIFLQDDVLSNCKIFIFEPVKWLWFYNENVELNISFTYGFPLEKINSSKFIFVPIFKLYEQILAEPEFKQIIFDKSPLTTCSYSDDNSKLLQLPLFDFTECYNVFEKRCFRMLFHMLKQMLIGESLVIQNFSILTHFNVGLLYIMASKCFEKTGFSSSESIILSNMMNKEALNYLEIIENECNRLQNGLDVLNCLSVHITNVGNFFNTIIVYNNTFYRNKCVSYLNAIRKTLK